MTDLLHFSDLYKGACSKDGWTMSWRTCVMPNTLPWHIGGFLHAPTFSLCLQGDMPAGQMINSLPGVDPARRDKVLQVLDIDPEWRMHKVSDGQRRRVQICMGLLKPPEVRLKCHLKLHWLLYNGSCNV